MTCYEAGLGTFLGSQSVGVEVGVHLPNYDVSADGERFVFTEPGGGRCPIDLRVVQNWFTQFRGREQD